MKMVLMNYQNNFAGLVALTKQLAENITVHEASYLGESLITFAVELRNLSCLPTVLDIARKDGQKSVLYIDGDGWHEIDTWGKVLSTGHSRIASSGEDYTKIFGKTLTYVVTSNQINHNK